MQDKTPPSHNSLSHMPPQGYFDEQEAMAKLVPIADELVALVQKVRAPQCLHQIQEPAAAEQAAWHAGLDEGRAQAAPAAVAVRDAVRDAEKLLRAEAARLERIYSGHGNKWYGFSDEKAAHIEHLRVADALAATPAAVQTHAEAAAALGINSALTRIRAGNHAEAIAPLEHALRALAATPAADAPAVPKWIDDPHDIEQGQMLNPEWVKAQQAAAAPAAVAGSAPCTFMTEDQARDWAWNKVREEVSTQGWTAGDSFNFHGFYLWGWNYRGQYELQRTATRSAVIQEILSAAPPAAAPVVLPQPDAVISEVMGLVDEWGMESHLRGAAELDAQHSEATQEEIDCAKDRASKERAAWKAIESKLRALLATCRVPDDYARS